MGISVSSLTQQLQDLRQDQADFQKDMKNQQKVKKDEDNLKKTVTEASDAVKGNKTPPKNAMMAYVEALSGMMASNQNVMGAYAQRLQEMDPLMSGINNQLNEISTEQAGLTQLSPEDALEKGQEVNAKMVGLEQNLAVIGVDSKQEGLRITTLSDANNTAGGQADQALDLIAKVNRMGH